MSYDPEGIKAKNKQTKKKLTGCSDEVKELREV